MLKKLLNKLKSLFSKAPQGPKYDVKAGDKVGNVTIGYLGLKPSKYFTKADIARLRGAQLVKHTKFEVGAQYRVGDGIATVHADKASMLAAIAAVDKRRELKEAMLIERGIELMLMSEEQISELKLNEWLDKRKSLGLKIDKIMGLSETSIKSNPTGRLKDIVVKRFLNPKVDQKAAIDAFTKERFEELAKESAASTETTTEVFGPLEKEKDRVH